jgi:hypothetical protein
VRWCPECGRGYPDAIAACPRCRAVLAAEPPPADEGEPVAIHRVPDAAAGALLCGLLVQNGYHALLRTATLPAYGVVRRDWNTTHWGEIVVPAAEATDARTLIADYLEALERGGLVRDEDVEGVPPED